jgi:glycerol-3-phosphate acyltransferase PlsY
VTGLPEQHGLFVFGCAMAVLIVYTHRDNVKRMLAGTESRFGRRFAAKR